MKLCIVKKLFICKIKCVSKWIKVNIVHTLSWNVDEEALKWDGYGIRTQNIESQKNKRETIHVNNAKWSGQSTWKLGWLFVLNAEWLYQEVCGGWLKTEVSNETLRGKKTLTQLWCARHGCSEIMMVVEERNMQRGNKWTCGRKSWRVRIWTWRIFIESNVYKLIQF